MGGGSGGCLRTATKLALGATVSWDGASRKLRTRLRIRRAEERVLRHGTVGLLLDIGDAGSDGDSIGYTVDGLGRPQTVVAALQQPRTRLRKFVGF